MFLISFLLSYLNPPLNMVDSFKRVYLNQWWGIPINDGFSNVYYSGYGSDKGKYAEYVEYVNDFLSRDDVFEVVEVGCGDMRLSSNYNFSAIDYICYDVHSGIAKDASNFLSRHSNAECSF